MNPLLWIAGGLLGMFAAKKAMAARMPPGAPLPGHPSMAIPPPGPQPIVKAGLDEPIIYTPPPSGWRRLKTAEVTPGLLAFANSERSTVTQKPYGTIIPFMDTRTGAQFAAMVEQHFHPPGGPVKPWGLHHGITLLARA
jgi:hypothetical protein